VRMMTLGVRLGLAEGEISHRGCTHETFDCQYVMHESFEDAHPDARRPATMRARRDIAGTICDLCLDGNEDCRRIKRVFLPRDEMRKAIVLIQRPSSPLKESNDVIKTRRSGSTAFNAGNDFSRKADASVLK